MKARDVIEGYVFKHYGNLTTVGDVGYEDETKKWIAELKSDYPRWIRDDKSGKEPTLRFIAMENIGKIIFDDNMNVIQATSRAECGGRIRDRLHLWREQAERIMVEASADQLAMARGADQFLSPVTTILDNLLTPLHTKPIITRADIESGGPNWLKYLSLLEDLQIVRAIPEENGWTYGPLFTQLLEDATQKQMSFERVVFSHILKNRYPSIRDIFHIGIFEKIIHLDSSYYWNALEAEAPIATEREHLFATYRIQYNDEDEDNMTLNSRLQELVRVHALKIENGYCIADEGILKQMLVLKHQTAEHGLLIR